MDRCGRGVGGQTSILLFELWNWKTSDMLAILLILGQWQRDLFSKFASFPYVMKIFFNVNNKYSGSFFFLKKKIRMCVLVIAMQFARMMPSFQYASCVSWCSLCHPLFHFIYLYCTNCYFLKKIASWFFVLGWARKSYCFKLHPKYCNFNEVYR